jgi:urease accessory protein
MVSTIMAFMATAMSMSDSPPRSRESLLRLCHLVSPALPVGAYAYSQALEYAVHAGWVQDEEGALQWLRGLAQQGLGTLDIPALLRLHVAWSGADVVAAREWNARLLAARETAELRAEDRHLGMSLARVLVELEIDAAREWIDAEPAFATMFALAAVGWNITAEETLLGYLWSWTENQVLAAVKLVPLGQSAGQRLLHRLIDDMPTIAARAQTIPDEDIGVGTWSQALASALHETQYTRLFRS